jgi:hypothetical protein
VQLPDLVCVVSAFQGQASNKGGFLYSHTHESNSGVGLGWICVRPVIVISVDSRDPEDLISSLLRVPLPDCDYGVMWCGDGDSGGRWVRLL